MPGMVAHSCNLNTKMVEAGGGGIAESSAPAWSTERVPDWSGLKEFFLTSCIRYISLFSDISEPGNMKHVCFYFQKELLSQEVYKSPFVFFLIFFQFVKKVTVYILRYIF